VTGGGGVKVNRGLITVLVSTATVVMTCSSIKTIVVVATGAEDDLHDVIVFVMVREKVGLHEGLVAKTAPRRRKSMMTLIRLMCILAEAAQGGLGLLLPRPRLIAGHDSHPAVKTPSA